MGLSIASFIPFIIFSNSSTLSLSIIKSIECATVELEGAYINNDSQVNILDVVILVSIILCN